MNVNRIRFSNPWRFLLSFLFWIGLEFLVWNVFSTEKILDKFPKQKKCAENVIHIACGILAHAFAVFFLDDLGMLFGIDLLD